MKMRTILATATLAVILGACGATGAPSPISVSDAWARAALASASGDDSMGGGAASSNSAIYMTIRNTGSAADRLVKAESDVAKSVELHTASMVNGVMQMRPVDAIDVPAGGSVALQPGGFHVMLVGLTRDLKAGATVRITLRFEKAGAIALDAPVRAG